MIAALAFAFAALPACAQSAPQKLIPLRVGYDGYSMTTAPMNYAVEKGIFKKYGLDVTLAYIDAGTTLSQAVVGGSINIAQNGYSPAPAAAAPVPGVDFNGGTFDRISSPLVVEVKLNTQP